VEWFDAEGHSLGFGPMLVSPPLLVGSSSIGTPPSDSSMSHDVSNRGTLSPNIIFEDSERSQNSSPSRDGQQIEVLKQLLFEIWREIAELAFRMELMNQRISMLLTLYVCPIPQQMEEFMHAQDAMLLQMLVRLPPSAPDDLVSRAPGQDHDKQISIGTTMFCSIHFNDKFLFK